MLNLNPLVINNFDSIKSFNEGIHIAIIIDDATLKTLKEEQLIKSLDSEDKTTFRVTHGSMIISIQTPEIFFKSLEKITPWTESEFL